MRIAHLCPDFSALSETFIYDTITELERQGCENHVVAANLWNLDTRPFPRVHHVPRPGSRDPRRLGRKLLAKLGAGRAEHADWPAYRRRVREALLAIRPDVLHAHFGTTGAQMQPLADELGLPLVVSFHGKDAFAHPETDTYRDAYAHLFRHAAAVTVVSRLMHAHLTGLGSSPERTHVVRVGKQVSEYPERKEPLRRTTRWVSVGRLDEKKGHLDALAAFASVAAEVPDAALRIVGTGPLQGTVEEAIREHGLGERVALLGAIPHDGVRREMQAADAFLLCSRTAANGDREGVPTVLMEAQLLGLPCVSTRHSGIPEVIPEEGLRFLSEEGDVRGIGAAMHALHAADPSELLELRRAGREKVEREFNLDTETARLIGIYGQVHAPADVSAPRRATAQPRWRTGTGEASGGEAAHRAPKPPAATRLP